MSSDDYGRNSDTVMAEAFRRAGVSPALPDDPKAGSRGSHLRLLVPGAWWPSAVNLGSGYSAELDLHGCSEDRAYEKLGKFVRECSRKGYCKVLVITGKGSGKLKRLVPLWLEARPFTEFVANACAADPWDGGDGALYVRLRER